MSDELKERPIDFESERPSQLEIDAAVAEITARLKAADAKDARIKELEAEKMEIVRHDSAQVLANDRLRLRIAGLEDTCLSMEAENQRLREALTPSEETKRAYWGSDEVEGSSWQAMKTLMQAIRQRALLGGGEK